MNVAVKPVPDHEHELGFVRRYIFSTDHKVIGKQYMALSAVMAIIGGFSAYIIRWQLAWPETSIPGWGPIGPDQYNAIITMHGTVMVFFVAMPFLLGGFGNFLIPIMVGADDMAFPRLNGMSFWTQFVASMILIASMFAPEGPAASGWTAYTPLSDNPLYTGVYLGQDLWILASALEFAAFLMGGINFLTTVFNMRAPGMTLMRLPLFVWMEITAAIVFLLSVGPLIAAAIMLLLDRRLGTSFFRPDKGGDPLMWEHLFWFFGHPEVYVVALPGFGIMLEIMPVFARKPIFGYRMMVYSTIAAGALSFIVWAHHMFVSGMDPRLATPFSITTIMISVPFAIIVFSMIASLWRSSIRFSAAMLFTLGGLITFIVGGVTGIFLGSQASDIYMHGTYFVVAHFHYTMFPVTFFGGIAGLYFWFPKMFGRMMNEFWGKVHFWLSFFAFNGIFLPLFLAGIGGQPRRIYELSSYEMLKPLQPLHVVATICLFGLLIAQVPFVINLFYSMVRGRVAEKNPWHANTLEWTLASPPPHPNFPVIPRIYRDPYEYSVREMTEDWLPQDQPMPIASATAAR